VAPETTDVLLPALGLEIEEAEILRWNVRVGDRVERGEPLATLGTDKTDVDLEAESAGYVVQILHEEGALVPVGTPVAVLASSPPEAPAEPVATAPADARAALPRLRRLTAERVTASQRVPQFDVFREVDIAAVKALVARVRAGGETGVGVNDVLVKAFAATLAEHGRLNAELTEGDDGFGLVEHGDVHVGFAVATEAGLVAPVLRDATSRTLPELAAERVRLTTAAQAGELAPDDLTGATTTVSSLARFAVDGFNAMVNPPQSSILAVGPARGRPVVREGRVVPGETFVLTLTVDHRVVDGAESAAALAALGDLLESDAELTALEDA
jgi:pyruvate dehydrogenase E2 component (dihydrolipoamide acetyltransferase)